MKNTNTINPAIYVGTYKKYNNGDLSGKWLNLNDYSSRAELLAACQAVHADESDPEFMVQDFEDFPDGLACSESIPSESEFNCIKIAVKEAQQEAEGKPALNIIEYSAKAFAVVGDTYPIRKQLKQLGGCFNGKLSCGAGWIFSNKSREAVAAFIAGGEAAASVKESKKAGGKDDNIFAEWLKEFEQISGDPCVKYYAGAIKLHGGYYLIDKPSIETRFCFHDEGPDYDYYKTLCSSDDKMAAHFLTANLRAFDSQISRIEKGEYGDKRVWWETHTRANGSKQIWLTFDPWRNTGTECTDDEKKLILRGLKYGKALFEKRLKSYLKRYGVAKLHTWTYWADA